MPAVIATPRVSDSMGKFRFTKVMEDGALVLFDSSPLAGIRMEDLPDAFFIELTFYLQLWHGEWDTMCRLSKVISRRWKKVLREHCECRQSTFAWLASWKYPHPVRVVHVLRRLTSNPLYHKCINPRLANADDPTFFLEIVVHAGAVDVLDWFLRNETDDRVVINSNLLRYAVLAEKEERERVEPCILRLLEDRRLWDDWLGVRGERSEQFLLDAVEGGFLLTVRRLLEQPATNPFFPRKAVDQEENSENALTVAAHKGRLDILRLLLDDHRVKSHLSNAFLRRLLRLAVANFRVEVVDHLLRVYPNDVYGHPFLQSLWDAELIPYRARGPESQSKKEFRDWRRIETIRVVLQHAWMLDPSTKGWAMQEAIEQRDHRLYALLMEHRLVQLAPLRPPPALRLLFWWRNLVSKP
jgi:hypothetical protein